MLYALEKQIMPEVSGHVQSQMRNPIFAVGLLYLQEC